MSPAGRSRVTVVVAAVNARRTIAGALKRFEDEAAGLGEVILVDASRDGTAQLALECAQRTAVIQQPLGALVPELWREGLQRTQTPLVAFSTAAMVPCRGWLRALVARLDETGAAVVGGPIVPGATLTRFDRALFLQRFWNYLPPLAQQGAIEPPGDNALYRREALGGLEPLWQQGFWEAPIHRQLRLRGERLEMAPEAVLAFQGGSHPLTVLRHRLAHARNYAAGRCAHWGFWQRVGRLAAVPVVPALLAARIVGALHGRARPLRSWAVAAPHLALLLAAWSFGEALGTWTGHSRHSPGKDHPASLPVDSPWAPAPLPR